MHPSAVRDRNWQAAACSLSAWQLGKLLQGKLWQLLGRIRPCCLKLLLVAGGQLMSCAPSAHPLGVHLTSLPPELALSFGN